VRVLAATERGKQALERAREAEYSYAINTSKRALSRWIRCNAVSPEWAGSGIPLNTIAPGLVKTALLSRLFESREGARHQGRLPDASRRAVRAACGR
jgi:NAD(P)-dependent dehydrogenase (short-subunit alcohol dehydrogenase family)